MHCPFSYLEKRFGKKCMQDHVVVSFNFTFPSLQHFSNSKKMARDIINVMFLSAKRKQQKYA